VREAYKALHIMPIIFVFRCPNTGLQVQGYTPKDVPENSEAYEGILCAMCQLIHLVKPAPGEVPAAGMTSPLVRVAHILCRAVTSLGFGRK
jgi:hypothetical protein